MPSTGSARWIGRIQQGQFESVADRFRWEPVGLGCGPVARRIDVGASGEHHGVESLGQGRRVGVDGQVHGQATGLDDAAGVVGEVQVEVPVEQRRRGTRRCRCRSCGGPVGRSGGAPWPVTVAASSAGPVGSGLPTASRCGPDVRCRPADPPRVGCRPRVASQLMTEPALVDVDATPIAYRAAGDPAAPVVLFLHGLGGGRTAWDPQLARCRREPAGRGLGHARLRGVGSGDRSARLRGDHRGVGRPARRPRRRDRAPGGAVVRGHARPARRAGESGSGRLADPGRHQPRVRPRRHDARRVARIAAGGLRCRGRHERRHVSCGRCPTSATQVVRAIAAPGFTGRGFDDSVAAFGRITVDAFRSACHCLVEHDLRGRLGAIEVPTLVVVGELDTETPPAYAAASPTRSPAPVWSRSRAPVIWCPPRPPRRSTACSSSSSTSV